MMFERKDLVRTGTGRRRGIKLSLKMTVKSAGAGEREEETADTRCVTAQRMTRGGGWRQGRN